MSFTLPQLHSGKVRELYDAGGDRLVMVASDRVSAFDVIMAEPIADKGRVLTAMSVFWYDELADVAPGSLLAADPGEIQAALPGQSLPGEWAGRALLVRRAEMLPIECIVRGYLAGQAHEEYERSGTVHGTVMPTGLKMADRLAEPIFTPSTKAAEGHDINISLLEAENLVGSEAARAARDICLELYARAAARAADVGFILADTKFELGLDMSDRAHPGGILVLGDEALKPDSSRYWPAEGFEVGRSQPSFDKQYVRDWAAASGWDKAPPAPPIPDDVVAGTRARYIEAYELITGQPFQAWLDSTAAA